jgi:putative methyltransferase (TIGR04325 family)
MLWRLRQKEIRVLSRWLIGRGPRSSALAAIAAVRDLPIAHTALTALLGYRRPFATLGDAAAAIAGYDGGGHLNVDYGSETSRAAAQARPSDYAALFHLQPLLPRLHRVFDLGGFVGTLYYCYARYLAFPPDLIWTVYDLPETREAGRRLADERKESRLRFASCLDEADNADLFIACGSLHYFEESLPDMIAKLKHKPPYVLINRAPMVEGGASFATVQDGRSYLLPCVVHSREELLKGFRSQGYGLVDEWRAPEHSLMVPGYPDRSVPAYFGMFLRRDGTDAG